MYIYIYKFIYIYNFNLYPSGSVSVENSSTSLCHWFFCCLPDLSCVHVTILLFPLIENHLSWFHFYLHLIPPFPCYPFEAKFLEELSVPTASNSPSLIVSKTHSSQAFMLIITLKVFLVRSVILLLWDPRSQFSLIIFLNKSVHLNSWSLPGCVFGALGPLHALKYQSFNNCQMDRYTSDCSTVVPTRCPSVYLASPLRCFIWCAHTHSVHHPCLLHWVPFETTFSVTQAKNLTVMFDLSLYFTPHPVLDEILLTLPSEDMWNLTSSQYFQC